MHSDIVIFIPMVQQWYSLLLRSFHFLLLKCFFRFSLEQPISVKCAHRRPHRRLLGVTFPQVQNQDSHSFPHIPAISLYLYAKNTTFILKGAASYTQAWSSVMKLRVKRSSATFAIRFPVEAQAEKGDIPVLLDLWVLLAHISIIQICVCWVCNEQSDCCFQCSLLQMLHACTIWMNNSLFKAQKFNKKLFFYMFWLPKGGGLILY